MEKITHKNMPDKDMKFLNNLHTYFDTKMNTKKGFKEMHFIQELKILSYFSAS